MQHCLLYSWRNRSFEDSMRVFFGLCFGVFEWSQLLFLRSYFGGMYNFPQIKYNVYYAKLSDIKIKFIRSNCQNWNGEREETKENEKEEKNEEIGLSKEEREKREGKMKENRSWGKKG